MSKFAIAIHGGAGDLPFWGMNPQREEEHKRSLEKCLLKGYSILKEKGRAIDAVEACIIALEDDPLFNAGKGSAINRMGEVEMDASIMDGKTLRAGAVSVVKGIKNPIALARKVMDDCEHLYLSGEGAIEFAKEIGLAFEPLPYFLTPERIDKWKNKYEEGGTADIKQDNGTAGCVALDINGNLAAGTSTGGLVNKRRGRVGDTALIGAGTYADNETAAVSCTGTGEYIIRSVTAHELCSLLKHRSLSLDEAGDLTFNKLRIFGGQFGMIAIDKIGKIKCVFNTERMFRAWIDTQGKMEIALY